MPETIVFVIDEEIQVNLNLACLPISPYPRSENRSACSHRHRTVTAATPVADLHRVQGVPERGVSISPVSKGSKEKSG